MSQVNLTVDATALVVPDRYDSRNEVHRYVESLLAWSDLLDSSWISVLMSDRACVALADDGVFPLRIQIRELILSHGLVEYTINDVMTVINRLLQQPISFERHFGIEKVEVKCCVVEPDISRFTTGQVRLNLENCLASIVFLQHHNAKNIVNHILAVRKSSTDSVEVRTSLWKLKISQGDSSVFLDGPRSFKGSVKVCDEFSGLIQSVDEEWILGHATNPSDVELAIGISVYKFRSSQGEVIDFREFQTICFDRWCVGSQFLARLQASIRGVGSSLIGPILRALIETIDGVNLSDTHRLRINKYGSSPQKIRKDDGAGAWRRRIDREYRLHYWKLPNGITELASVNPHNDFSIPN